MGAPFDLSVKDGIGLVTFNRPKSLNSLTFEVYRELAYDGLRAEIDLEG